jgi:acyl-CoA thioesterase
MLDFSQSLALRQVSEDVFAGRTDPDYFMRTGPYGGWVAAILLKAALSHNKAATFNDPVSITISFLAPITAADFRLVITLQKLTRTLCFLRVDARQDIDGADELAASALVILGPRRGDLHLADISAPKDLPPPDGVPVFSPLPTMPAFFNRYQLRYITSRPFAENPTAHSLIYVRDHPARPLDVLSLAALCDVSPPRPFFRGANVAPFATVTMSVYFQTSVADIAKIGAEEVVIEARMRQAKAGFSDQTLEVWSQAGVLLASSEQMCWFRG